MITPIMPIQPIVNPPRAPHRAFMRIDYNKHTIVIDDGRNITLPAPEAWALLDEIKSGRIYDDRA